MSAPKATNAAPPEAGRLLLRAENLCLGFGDRAAPRWVVEGLNFELRAGSCLGLVGESGSGKSLTALTLLGLQPPQATFATESRLWYHPADGPPVDLLRLPEKQLRAYRGRCLAMVFQEPMTALNPVMTCGQQVGEALRLHAGLRGVAARARCEELFAEVQLPDPPRIWASYPHQISGGQKQRVLLAMALACRPEILVADEPTTALDVTVQRSLLELIARLQLERQLALLFISHDLGVVKRVADRTAVLRHGRLVESGPTAALFAAPRHPYTQGLIACRPPIDRPLERLPVLADFERPPAERPPVHVVDAGAQAAHVARLHAQSPVLQVEGLNIRYRSKGREVQAARDVHFAVYPGECLGLVGESGSGKTSIGRAILRLVEAESGRITFRGQDWLALEGQALRRARRALQLVFQDPYGSLNPRLTVAQALMEPLRVHGLRRTRRERRERAAELLELVGLPAEHLDRYPHQCSGGQRQRICIARCLAVEPELIVCDESVSALDVSVQALVLNLLRDLQQRLGLSYLFITHDLAVVRFLCDRVLVLQQGEVVESGLVGQVLDTPAHAYTRQLLASVLG